MAIDLEQKAAYPIRIGASVLKSGSNSTDLTQRVVSDDGTFEEDGFHLVSRQLPRTTTKLSRETLESGENVRTRQLGTTARSAEDGGKQSVLIEIDAHDQKSTCTYEGDFEPVPFSDNIEAHSDDGENDEIECVLIYDEESKAFVIERVASHIAVRSGAPSGVSLVSAGTSAGQLALPTNKHGSPKERVRAASKRDTPSLVDEASEDELAKELEGMLDDASDMGDVALTGSSRLRSRRSSEQPTQKWDSLDDQLNMELAENLDEALLEDVGSDDDEFEEVDGAQFLDSETGDSDEAARNLVAEIESLPDNRSDDDDDDDDDMAFEEVDPSAELDARPNSRLALSGNRAGLSAEFEDFEEIGTPLTGQSNATNSIDDSLFSGSASPSLLSPRRYEQRNLNQARRQKGGSVSADADTETLDEFEDLDLDLTRSLEDS
ncbi:hypothetical protein GGF42_003853 [Coemansia sp. RSA 2424]|nr:hypothetical protein GGF42_003853 [Coemansia sp. RSA 2424]